MWRLLCKVAPLDSDFACLPMDVTTFMLECTKKTRCSACLERHTEAAQGAALLLQPRGRAGFRPELSCLALWICPIGSFHS